MMHLERRSGKDKPVIAKALVEMGGAPMRAFAAARPLWAIQDSFQSPGPIQVSGRVGGCVRAVVELHTMRGQSRRGRAKRQSPALLPDNMPFDPACLPSIPPPPPPHPTCLAHRLQFEGRCADEANITLALEVNGGAPILLAEDDGCAACGRAPDARA
jgi:hypothetical protein